MFVRSKVSKIHKKNATEIGEMRGKNQTAEKYC